MPSLHDWLRDPFGLSAAADRNIRSREPFIMPPMHATVGWVPLRGEKPRKPRNAELAKLLHNRYGK